MIRNYIELAVEEAVDEVMHMYQKKNPDFCTCERCKLDIMAIALNSLPTKYVVTHNGGIFTKVALEQVTGRAQISAAIGNACKIVHANPRHASGEDLVVNLSINEEDQS